MNIFKYLNYREFIKDFAQRLQLSSKVLAERTGIHPAYFSRVLLAKADFSTDQLMSLGKVFDLNSEQTEYLTLLGDHSRSGKAEHRQSLRQRIDEKRQKHLRLSSELKNNEVQNISETDLLAEYYEQILTQEIHMFLTIDRYRKSPDLIARKLGLSEKRLKAELLRLEKVGLLKQERNSLNLVRANILLDELSPLARQNHVNWRLHSVQHLMAREATHSDYRFSAAFSADEDVKQKVRQLFKEFAVKVQHLASDCEPADGVYRVLFDLY
jgi:uncharacterized protein (TIGR02147 family)